MSTGLGIPAELVPSLGDSPPDVVSSEATACPVLQAATTKWFGDPSKVGRALSSRRYNRLAWA